jgi:hypothetical protein
MARNTELMQGAETLAILLFMHVLIRYWLRVFRFSRLEESIEKANLREGNLDQGDFEIFCALNLDFVVEPTCGIGAQMRPSRKGIGC